MVSHRHTLHCNSLELQEKSIVIDISYDPSYDGERFRKIRDGDIYFGVPNMAGTPPAPIRLP